MQKENSKTTKKKRYPPCTYKKKKITKFFSNYYATVFLCFVCLSCLDLPIHPL